MNDLQKAQAFLNSRNFKIEQLAKQIGCSSRQISKYISGEAKLEGAKWSIIQQLAHLYDQKKYHDLSDSPDFLQFITKMGAWFQ
ncbi:XRE family transcriptional regulator, partial [Lactobacillus sp. XV13L]|nr:XRE family transcriptional regulator [Lactobacillus sp. XV13L]